MRNFDFHNPTRLIFGKDTAGRIGGEIAACGAKKVLLVAGGGSIRANGVYDAAARSLRQAGVEWTEAWGVRPNPVLSKVHEMICAARECGAEAVLAAGGGSVLDSAKAVAAGVVNGDVWEYFETHRPVERALPLYTILTLSATGTEMNPFAVITKEDEKKKWAVFGPALYPRVSIVDPSVQMSLPWRQTVNGAIDTISHIQELYFPGRDAETTLALDESLLRSVIAVTDRLQADPSDYPARAALAWASTLALNGVSAAGHGDGDWATHGLEHGVSAVCPHIAHAEGLAVLFPAWILHCHQGNPPTFRRWAKNVWGKETVEEAVAAYRAKIRAWGGPLTLKELGVREDQLDEIAGNGYRVGAHGEVKRLSRGDFQAIVRSAYQ